MHRGYVKIWRKLEDSGLLQMHSTLALFMFMLMQASHKAKKIGTSMGVIQLERGQFISGRHKLAAAIELTEQKVRTCLDNLHNMDIITSESTSKFTIYTIVNYSEYQSSDEAATNESTSEQPASNQQVTNKQPTDNQQITTKQELKHLSIKELKNGSKSITPLKILLSLGVDEQAANDWLLVRKTKRAPFTETALNDLKTEAEKAGLTIAQAVAICAKKSWQGFNASWNWDDKPLGRGGVSSKSENDQIREAARKRIFGEQEIESV